MANFQSMSHNSFPCIRYNNIAIFLITELKKSYILSYILIWNNFDLIVCKNLHCKSLQISYYSHRTCTLNNPPIAPHLPQLFTKSRAPWTINRGISAGDNTTAAVKSLVYLLAAMREMKLRLSRMSHALARKDFRLNRRELANVYLRVYAWRRWAVRSLCRDDD